MRPRLRLLVLTLTLAACAGAPAGSSPSPLPSPSPIPSPSPLPSPSPNPESAFYLRAWFTQALPPVHTFGWLPMLTIAEGTLIDGNIAVPAIFPGPLLTSPVSRSISDAGIAAIVDEAQRMGLLSGATNFAGDAAMPGARLGQIQLVIDGVTYDLTGSPDAIVRCGGARCVADPGTPEAFAAFWQELSTIQTWLEPELGATVPFVAERVALLLGPAGEVDPSLAQAPVAWPFETPLADAGVPFPGEAGARCVTLSAEALDTLLPLLQAGNQATVFVDDAGTLRSPVSRMLVLGEDSPCPDAG